ncbi:IS30 family transposase [Escherichia coli]
MSFGQPCDEFPLSSLPPLIRDAVIEAQQITQAPLGLVAASALGAVSLVCQNLIDVCRLNTLRGPVSLFFLTLAESGERKTAVDKLLMKPLYQQELQLYSRYKSELAVWKNKEELLKAQKKALLSKLNKELRKGADESETLRQLEVLQKNSAEEPVRYKFIFNDATTAAIKNQLCGKWRSVGIMSDEAGIIFDGYTLSELPFINKMWDGSVLSVDRKNEPEQMIENARMTLSLMVQPGLFDRYMEHLRRSHSLRHGRRHTRKGERGTINIVNGTPIHERSRNIDNRRSLGHWEGDLVSGTKNSHIATLVDRKSRYTIILRLRGKDSVSVNQALTDKFLSLPSELRKSLTWDRGMELARHLEFTVSTGVKVYFCDPQSPWQRGTNENTNGLIRQYFPKKTCLAQYTQHELDLVAAQLNNRPRKTLKFKTPKEIIERGVALTD